MATYYIDPTVAGAGTGTLVDPFQSWASVTWGAGNTYLQKAGTTYLGAVTIGASGASGSPITVGRYGTGANPIINAGGGAALGALYAVNRSYITVIDVATTCPTSSSNGTGVYMYSQSAGGGQSIQLIRVDAYNTKGSGISLVQYRTGNSNPASTGILLDRCTATDCGSVGIAIAGKVSNAVLSRCVSTRCGLTVDHYGLAMGTIKKIIAAGAGAWTLSSGTIYTIALTLANINSALSGALDYITHVSVASDTYGDLLQENTSTPTAPGVGEFGFVPGTGLLYVNLGVASSLFPEIRVAPDSCTGTFDRCEVYDQNKVSVEGVGIAADDMSTIRIDRCKSIRSGGHGFSLHRGRGSMVNSCLAIGNGNVGIKIVGAPDSVIRGNTVINNSTAGVQSSSGSSNSTIKNNIVQGSTTGIIGRSDTVASHNAYLNNVTNISGVTSGGNDITTDPLLSGTYRPQAGSPLIGAGVHLGYTRDLEGKQRPNPPSIGAYDVATLRAV